MKRRWRRWGKWAGTGIALCILAVWVASGWYSGLIVCKGRFTVTQVICDAGLICVHRTDAWEHWADRPDGTSMNTTYRGPGPTWERDWRPWTDVPALPRRKWAWTCTVPLWNLFALVLLPTAFLWYRDRRHPPGCCPRCGYDLSGNSSGICPECGRASSKGGNAEGAEGHGGTQSKEHGKENGGGGTSSSH